jgi:hypothetical protein
VLVALAAAHGARGDTLNVPTNFDTIQDAIDVAVDGDSVVVAPGRYLERIDLLGKAIIVRSSAGPTLTTIDAASTGPVVRCTSDEGSATVLRGFTITGGSGSVDGNDQSFGGGLLVCHASPRVIDCIFTVNAANFGAGIFCEGGGTQVVDCEFSGNVAGDTGGGVRCEGGETLLLDCVFNLNSAQVGGAVGLLDDGSRLVGCTFLGNLATAGGAVHVRDSTVEISGCFFEANVAINGGGFLADQGAPVVSRSTFVGNVASSRGGGVHNNNTDVVIANSLLTGNRTDGLGGAAWNSNSDAWFVNCVMSGNLALLGGGLANDSGGNVLVYNSALSGNAASLGGGIHNSLATVPTILNAIVWGNVGGAIVGDATVEYSDVEGGFVGANVVDVDPMFVDSDGLDDELGTPDDDLRLAAGSSLIDAAANFLVAPDAADIDGDGDTSEPTPLDLDDNPRFFDDPGSADRGLGDPPVVDVGPYEFGSKVINPFDINGDGIVGVDDLLEVILSWGACRFPPTPCPADVTGDGSVDVDDLLLVILNFG